MADTLTVKGRYRTWVYPLLARLDPERSHRLALRLLRVSQVFPDRIDPLGLFATPLDPRLRVERFGLSFANPVGVAAGFDKDGTAVAPLLSLGFGAVEVGTVTPRPQVGNPPPRLWRFPEEGALINALGFPSHGAADVRQRLIGRRFSGIVGINLGKNRETPGIHAAEDYVAALSTLWDAADYFVVNVSSPNTPGLRDLQRSEALTGILLALMEQNTQSARLHDAPKRPILVKISPDLDDEGLESVLAGSLDGGASGIIVANTSTDRGLLTQQVPSLPGGLSGSPISGRAVSLTRAVYQQTNGQLPIIGVGGIATAADVVERMRAGASLVQLYTAFVYGGPCLPGRIARDLLSFVEREGLHSISEIVGNE
ncbi:MAG TPA: quinone-dependent dihydroorotate dehydrogenase [Nitrolancea sp.]|nr:quinone-dependent dihydroorotate dehydrogenase [Nitrolancea sp.]